MWGPGEVCEGGGMVRGSESLCACGCRLRGVMYCPQCKAEYRQGFTRCADCDVELVGEYMEAVGQLLTKKVVASDEYEARLWSGEDPHFYVELLARLWNKKVPCYGAPENPPMPKPVAGQQTAAWEPGGFEVWVSEVNFPLAKWILESAITEFEKNPPEERCARASANEVSPDTTGVCPLCLGEFATASSLCPNCGVPLQLPQPDMRIEDSARLLCNLRHPKFIVDLRKALQTARIPFNNANSAGGDFISGRYVIPDYDVVVLVEDFARATRVMTQILQHWEFEPSAGLWIGQDVLADYLPVRTTENGWLPEDISTLAWSGPNLVTLEVICMALLEHEIPYRVDTEQLGTAKIFTHLEDEARVRGIAQEVVEGAPPE